MDNKYRLTIESRLGTGELVKQYNAALVKLSGMGKVDVKVQLDKEGRLKSYVAQLTQANGQVNKLTGSIDKQSKELKEEEAIIRKAETATKQYSESLKRLIKEKRLDKEITEKKNQLESQGIKVKEKLYTKNGKLVKGTLSYVNANGKAVTVTKSYGRSLDKTTANVKSLATQTDITKKKTGGFRGSMLQGAKTAVIYALSIGAVYKALSELKRGIDYIKDLDKAMTDTQIVSGYTEKQIDSLSQSYNELAREMGVTTLEIANGSLEFIRQGKTAEETAELVRSSMMMATLGNLEAAQSTEYLTSIMNAYKLSVDELPGVIDKIINLDNTFATSTEEIASALRRSALSAGQAGVSLEELAAMIATVSQVSRREGNVVGTSLRTIFTRFQDVAKGNLDEDGMGINNVDDALRRVGITIRDDAGEFREFTDVLEDLYPIWENLGSIEQAN